MNFEVNRWPSIALWSSSPLELFEASIPTNKNISYVRRHNIALICDSAASAISRKYHSW